MPLKQKKSRASYKGDKLPEYLHKNERDVIRLIIACRHAQGLTIAEAAKLAGIPEYRWKGIEAGKYRHYYNKIGYLHYLLNKIGCTLELRAVSVVDYRPLFGFDPAEPEKGKKILSG